MPRVPRVTSRREALRLGGHRGAEFRHVGAAERDEAGRPELLRQERRHRPGHLTHRPDAERGGLALDRAAQVLEQDGNTAERPGGQVPVGLLPGRVEPGPDDGVKLRVDRLDAGDGRLGEFLRAYLSAPDEVGLSRGVQPSHVGHTAHATNLAIGVSAFGLVVTAARPWADPVTRTLMGMQDDDTVPVGADVPVSVYSNKYSVFVQLRYRYRLYPSVRLTAAKATQERAWLGEVSAVVLQQALA